MIGMFKDVAIYGKGGIEKSTTTQNLTARFQAKNTNPSRIHITDKIRP